MIDQTMARKFMKSNKRPVNIDTTRDKFIQVNIGNSSAYVVQFDIMAKNGVMHAIDTVLL